MTEQWCSIGTYESAMPLHMHRHCTGHIVPPGPSTSSALHALLDTYQHALHLLSIHAASATPGGTRTCIHTPGAPMTPEEMTPNLIARALDGAALVYFDGRLTEAATLLAQAARDAGVPVLVEGERLRPGLQHLLQLADYVVTSAHFPQVSSS